MLESTGGCIPLLIRVDKHLSNMSSLIEITRLRIRSWSPRVPAAEARMAELLLLLLVLLLLLLLDYIAVGFVAQR